MTTLAQLERGVVGYWCPMLATTGLRLYDRSGRGNHGTLTNMDAASDWVTASVRGRSGRVLDFDGTNDYVSIPSNPSIAGLGSLTVSAWVNCSTLPPAIQGNRMWIFTKLNTNNAEWELSINAFNNATVPYGRFAFASYNLTATANRLVGSVTAPVVNTWYHVCVTQNGRASDPQIYVNGELDNGNRSSTGTPVAGSGTAPVEIGRRATNTERTWNGEQAENQIWNRALTASEIQTLYRIGPGWFGQRQPRRRYAITQAAGFNAYWARQQSTIIGGGVR